jgi:exopolyphosphatase/guanosine-5'-triphosphate,3'-diphosphate pyrophosphatase
MGIDNKEDFVAALDLGTNTFNLAIAKSQPPFSIVFRTEKGVFLGKGGLASKEIVSDAVQRAQKVLAEYSSILSNYRLKKLSCVATEAIRNASNAKDVLRTLEIDVPFSVETIPGDREAELVYKGVKSTGLLSDNNILIMDIGGGSVEFIIGNRDSIQWKKSFKIGISRALEKIPLSDPPRRDELNEHRLYFEENLQELSDYIAKYTIKDLIGTAGSFDSWRKMIGEQNLDHPYSELNKEKLLELINTINSIPLADRLKIKGMEEMRIETIVPAGILVEYLLNSFNFESIHQCAYSLSEGVLWEMINE